jgi:hypothetical protein
MSLPVQVVKTVAKLLSCDTENLQKSLCQRVNLIKGEKFVILLKCQEVSWNQSHPVIIIFIAFKEFQFPIFGVIQFQIILSLKIFSSLFFLFRQLTIGTHLQKSFMQNCSVGW